jgi:hypothetical protein
MLNMLFLITVVVIVIIIIIISFLHKIRRKYVR